MNRVPSVQMCCVESRYAYGLSAKVFQCGSQSVEIAGINQHQQVQIAAEFRRAVKHARLAAHEQRFHATLPDRRKGSEYRALVQAIPPALNRSPTTSWIRGTAPVA